MDIRKFHRQASTVRVRRREEMSKFEDRIIGEERLCNIFMLFTAVGSKYM